MKVQIAKWGRSLAVRLPKQLVEQLDLEPGKTVELAWDGTKLVMGTIPKAKLPHYRLEDLLAQIKPGQEPPPSVDWGPDVGAEMLPEDEYSRGEITPDDLPKKRDV